MTTILQAPLPGANPFEQSSTIHSSSYTDLSSIQHSMPYEHGSDHKAAYLHAEYDKTYPSSAPSSAPSSPQYQYTQSMFSRQDSYSSTPASSLSLDQADEDDDDIAFPSYDSSNLYSKRQELSVLDDISDDRSTNGTPTPSWESRPDLSDAVTDDQAIQHEPTRHVDYLSHEWKEEDIWSSWRYIVERRKKISNSVRLENASWRTWMKAKNNLKTVSPETLNWLKDCDVTWLYGPLQTDTKKSMLDGHSPPPSRLSTSSSFLCKKPILKKKSASAAILERSRSQHSLLQRAGEIIRVQQSSPSLHGRPSLRRGDGSFSLPSYTGSSVVNTPAEHETPMGLSARNSFHFPEVPTPSDSKHVLFNEEVRQVRAIDSEDDEKEEEVDEIESESDEDDDGGLMMAPARSRSNSRTTPRGSFSNDNKTIVPLPPTTLKNRTDTPEPAQTVSSAMLWPSGRKLSPSPSQETLRPPRPSHNFLIDDDPEVSDEPWRSQNGIAYSPYEDENEPSPNMRRTASGMFMPYDENEEEATPNNTLLGQAMYAVNTFKDIAHVVWNVGWTRR